MKTVEEIQKQIKEHEDSYNFLRYPEQYPMPDCFKKLSPERQEIIIRDRLVIAQMEFAAMFCLKWVIS